MFNEKQLEITGITYNPETFKRNFLKYYHWGWFFPCFIFCGYLFTFFHFDGFALEYFALTLLSIFSCCLLISALRKPLSTTLHVWLILSIFVFAYYFKFYLIVSYPEMVEHIWFSHLHWIAESEGVLIRAYTVVSSAFFIFCLTAWSFMIIVKSHSLSITKKTIDSKLPIFLLIFFILFLMLTTSYIMYSTGLGRMGAVPVNLPYRLSGWIFFSRLIFIPGLLLLLIWISDQSNSRKYFNLGIILFIIYGLSEVLLRSSRGALLGLFILLLFFFFYTGKITKKRLMLFMAVFFITLLLFPIINQYRYIRLGAVNVSIFDALNESLIQKQGMFYWESLIDVFWNIVFRVSGVDCMLPILAGGFEYLGIGNLFNHSVERFYTYSILGYPEYATIGTSPSFLGWLYIVGGYYFTLFGVFCFVLILMIAWHVITRSKLYCKPVAASIFLFFIIFQLSEGAMHRLHLITLTIIGSIFICEFFLRSTKSLIFEKKIINKNH